MPVLLEIIWWCRWKGGRSDQSAVKIHFSDYRSSSPGIDEAIIDKRIRIVFPIWPQEIDFENVKKWAFEAERSIGGTCSGISGSIRGLHSIFGLRQRGNVIIMGFVRSESRILHCAYSNLFAKSTFVIISLFLLFGACKGISYAVDRSNIIFVILALFLSALSLISFLYAVGIFNSFEHRSFLAPLNRLSEDIRVLPVIITELELGNIERHIFAAHFVERPDYAALEDRPEAFDGLSVNCADDILPSRMINSHVRVVLVERIVARILIGAKQATLCDTASRTNAVRVAEFTFATTRATTLPLRLTAPTIGVLPEPMPPVPPPPPRLSQCLFFALVRFQAALISGFWILLLDPADQSFEIKSYLPAWLRAPNQAANPLLQAQ